MQKLTEGHSHSPSGVLGRRWIPELTLSHSKGSSLRMLPGSLISSWQVHLDNPREQCQLYRSLGSVFSQVREYVLGLTLCERCISHCYLIWTFHLNSITRPTAISEPSSTSPFVATHTLIQNNNISQYKGLQNPTHQKKRPNTVSVTAYVILIVHYCNNKYSFDD